MKQSPKQVINNHKKIIAKMIESFIFKAQNEPPEKVLDLYNSFAKDWDRRVRSVNARQGQAVLSYDVWDRCWKDEGYLKAISIPIPIQLPESEKVILRAYKKELIRIVYIVEGKTEHQRQRRQIYYKSIFLRIKITGWIKSLFAKKELPKMQVV